MSKPIANPWSNTAFLCDQLGDAVRVLNLPLFPATKATKLAGPCVPVTVSGGRRGLIKMLNNSSNVSPRSVLIINTADDHQSVYVNWQMLQRAFPLFGGIVVLGAIRDGALLRGTKDLIKPIFAIARHPRQAPASIGECHHAEIIIDDVVITSADHVVIDTDGAVVVNSDLLDAKKREYAAKQDKMQRT